MRRISYWEKELKPAMYELVVIGGGVTGQSVAYYYKQKYPEARVLVIDRGEIPAGASTRNAGFACVGTVGEHMADRELERDDVIKQRIALRLRGLELLQRALGKDAIGFEPVGGYELFTSQSEFEDAERHIGEMNSWMKDLTGISQFYKADQYNGYPVIRNEVEGVLHPGRMIRRYTELNTSLGVDFQWNTNVSRINEEDMTVVENEKLISRSKLIVIAANAFSSSLISKYSLRPARGYVFVTTPLKQLKWKGSFHYDRGYIYFRHLGHDRLLIGGARNIDPQAEETYEFGLNPNIRSYLRTFASDTLELPQGWDIEEEWSGIMGFTESKSPYVEEYAPGIWISAGLSGMGIAISSAISKDLAEKL